MAQECAALAGRPHLLAEWVAAELSRCRPEVALARVEELLRDASSTERAELRALRAQIRSWVGQAAEAAEEARGVLAERRGGAAAARSARVLGRVAAADDPEGALLRFDEAAALARDASDRAGLAEAHLDAAEVLLDRGGPADPSAAVGRLAEARDVIEGAGLHALRARLDLLLARARAASGDVVGASDELDAQIERAAARGDRDLEWRAWAAAAEVSHRRGAELAARRAGERALELLEAIATGLSPALRDAFWAEPLRRQARARAAPPEAAQARAADPFADGRLARLLEILKRLASEHDLDRLLERITDSAIELVGAERGFVLLTDESGSLMPHTVRDAASPEDPHVAFSRSIAEAVLIDGEPILTIDARADRRLAEYVSVHKLMLKSVAAVPIRGRAGAVGVLYLEHRLRRGRFGEADLDLLLAFADQAAIALENARMLASLERRRQELEEANAELGRANAEIERLLDARTVELAEARNELVRARDALRVANDRFGIVGRSDPMRRVFAIVDRVRDTEVSVVIQGESGTGKELVARAIHFGSVRSSRPFVALNCAAIPEGLLESEIFGHVRGAFTGAERDRAGVLVRASGGTLFLDEVGDMPAKMQVDLLRVLQDRRVRPVGGEEDVTVDVRVIAASNKPLKELVERGRFREDLYYRLSVVELWLPALRDRIGDIPLLCDHFLATFAKRDGASPKRISRAAVERLACHPLPGNVRQLEHLLLNAWVMVDDDVIDADDLALGDDGTGLASTPRLDRALAPQEPLDPARVMPASLEEFKDQERARILEALEAHAWNRVRAAQALGMARRTFYRRLKEYEIL